MLKLKIDDNLIRILLLVLFLFILYSFILLPVDFLLPLRFTVNDSIFNRLKSISNPSREIQEIVIVGIDEETLIETAKKWPWSRNFFAEIIDKLSMYNPKAIGLDITFFGASENPQEDERLAEAFRRAGNVILASYITERGDYIAPHSPFLSSAYGYGFVNKLSDADYKIRKARLVYQEPSFPRRYFSFEVILLSQYLGVPLDKIFYREGSVVISRKYSSMLNKDIIIPADRKGTIYINYLPIRHLSSVSLKDILKDEDDLGYFLKDKVVLLGQTSKTLHDIYQTPEGILPGVSINAFAFNTYLKEMFIYDFPDFLQLLIAFILVVLTAVFSYQLSSPRGILFLGLEIFLVLTAFLGASFFNLKLDYFSLLLMIILSYSTGSIYKYGYLLYSSNRLKRMVITDSLTGLATPRYFQFKLQLDMSRTSDAKAGISVVIFSIKEFQGLQKRYSREQLEFILKQLSIVLKENSRKKADLLTRWEEDKFAAILPKTNIDDTRVYSQKILSKIRETEFMVSEETEHIIVYAGICSFPATKTQSAADLIACAEAAGNRANLGSQEICVFDPKQDKVHLSVLQKRVLPSEEEYLSVDFAERERELLDTLNELKKSQQEIQKAHFETILSLVVALEEKDPYTAGHSERVGEYAVGIGREMGLEEDEIRLVRQSALLHDIGKFGLPDRILHKKEKLTEEEIEQIKKHPVMGARILERSKFFDNHIPLILHHHERYDGKGYPHGLSGKFIPRGAHIIGIADAIDAMTTGRGYNRVFSIDETVEELKKSSGTHFDPEYIAPVINFLLHSSKRDK